MALLENGFLRGFDVDMDESTYMADPCPSPSLSSHIAKILVSKSPAHAYAAHPRLGGKVEERERHFDLGTALHALVLGKGKRIVRIDAENYRKKDAQEARDAAYDAGQIPVLPHEEEELLAASSAVAARLLSRGLTFGGVSEVSVFWVERADDGTEVQCKGRFDHFTASLAEVIDLKSSRSAHPRAIAKHVEAYGYDIQSEAYRSGVTACMPELAGRVAYRWVFAELADPYAVVVAEPAGSFRALGASRWRRAVNVWAECLRTNEWPCYLDNEVLRVEAPPWAMSDEMSAGMSSDVPFGGDEGEGEAA